MPHATRTEPRLGRVLLIPLLVLGLAFCTRQEQETASTMAGDTAGMPGAAAPPAAETTPPGGMPASLSPGEVGAILSATDSAEIAPSILAQQRAEHPEVKAYAERMMTDHGMLEDSLRALEQRRNISPSPTAISQQLHQMTQNAVQRLQGLSGSEFDRAYMQNMVESHEQALAIVDNQVLPATQDPELREAIQQKVRPLIVSHLQSAQQIQQQLGSQQPGAQQPGAQQPGSQQPGAQPPGSR